MTVEEATMVTLDGSNSSDPDGDSLNYSWTQISGPNVMLTDADTVTPEFTAPEVDSETDLTFELTVDDGDASDTDTTIVTVTDSNTPPTADAGDDQTIEVQATVTLDGSNSSDPDGDSLSYSWRQTAGPNVTLADADTATPEFTAPDVDDPTDLTFELTVDDGDASETDRTVVTVTNSETGRDGPPPITGDDPPQDLNGDGLYRDVDGDGQFAIGDVQVFFQERGSDVVQNNPEYFNFDGEDPANVTIRDVQALFQDLIEES
jgi:hypothetical protein